MGLLRGHSEAAASGGLQPERATPPRGARSPALVAGECRHGELPSPQRPKSLEEPLEEPLEPQHARGAAVQARKEAVPPRGPPPSKGTKRQAAAPPLSPVRAPAARAARRSIARPPQGPCA